MTRRRGTRVAAGWLAGAVLVAVVVAGCSEPEPEPEDTFSLPPSTQTATDPPGLTDVLDVDFDALGPAGTALAAGAPVLAGQGAEQGELRTEGAAAPVMEPGLDGSALRLAVPCDPHEQCPKAIVEFADQPNLNPGTRDFRWGATLQMQPDETSKGSNILQKGFNNGGASQWKLQVDGTEGLPSCVLVGTNPEDEYILQARKGVADGRWHTVECRREGASLTVLVDDVESGSVPIDPATDVTPPSPLHVGGKSIKQDNDQYFGLIDSVFVQLVDP